MNHFTGHRELSRLLHNRQPPARNICRRRCVLEDCLAQRTRHQECGPRWAGLAVQIHWQLLNWDGRERLVHPGSIRAPVRRAMAHCREEAGFESGLDHHHPHAKSQSLAAMLEQRSLTHELPHVRAHLHDACPKTKGPPFLEALVCTHHGVRNPTIKSHCNSPICTHMETEIPYGPSVQAADLHPPPSHQRLSQDASRGPDEERD